MDRDIHLALIRCEDTFRRFITAWLDIQIPVSRVICGWLSKHKFTTFKGIGESVYLSKNVVRTQQRGVRFHGIMRHSLHLLGKYLNAFMIKVFLSESSQIFSYPEVKSIFSFRWDVSVYNIGASISLPRIDTINNTGYISC